MCLQNPKTEEKKKKFENFSILYLNCEYSLFLILGYLLSIMIWQEQTTLISSNHKIIDNWLIFINSFILNFNYWSVIN